MGFWGSRGSAVTAPGGTITVNVNRQLTMLDWAATST
jgi:hypothetical protein